MEQILLFIGTFLLVFLLYYFTTVRKELRKEKLKKHPRKAKKKKRLRAKPKEDRLPTEVQYLVVRYHLDLKKISYTKLLYLIALVASLDISLVVTIVSFIPWIIVQLIVGFVLALGVIVISFHFIGKHYEKKGNKKHV